ncbi:MAG TPA: hypothetical protein VLJ80_09145 [Solirubrobacteraceae bacterium]|nr:hypothetical protein [Solirubrobacteraceae bacterium]
MIDTLVIASTVDDDAEEGEGVSGERADAARALTQAAAAFAAGEALTAASALEHAGRALEKLSFGAPSARMRLLARAGEEHRLVALREMRPLAEAVLIYDNYFGVARVVRSSFCEQAAAAAPVLAELCRCLAKVPIALDARSALAGFCARVLGDAGDRDGDVQAVVAESGATPDPLVLWKLGHLLYSLANRSAARHLREASDEIARGDLPRACVLLGEAARAVEAGSASMELASALTRSQYCREVRPTMCPPALEIALSGAMNPDHHALRQALSRVLASADAPNVAALGEHSGLAAATERLLDADVADLERHITLSLRLVGSGPALDEADEQSAVGSLRSMYIERLDRYAARLRRDRATEDGRRYQPAAAEHA